MVMNIGDITTTATPALVNAVANPPIDDGWTGSGAKEFELHIARLTSRPAALFTVSSTMGNQLALRTYLNSPPNGVLCDSRSHLLHMEVGAVASISGGLLQTIIPSNGLYLTLEDIRKKVVLADGSDACVCPTRVIHLENPLGGIVMPLAELQRIKRFAEEHGLKVHMDGARLWEAVAAGAGSLDEFCAAVDSMNLCLTKGLGASVGAVLVGDAAFIHHCRWVRKIFGGAMRQPGWAAATAWAAVDSVFGRDPSGRESALLRKSHGHAQMLAEHWLHLGGSLLVPQQTNMVWLDLNAAGIDEEDWELRGEEMGLKLHCGRLVTHHREFTIFMLRMFSGIPSRRWRGLTRSRNHRRGG